MKDKIRSVQIFNQSNDMIYECNRNYFFPVKYVDNKPVDNIMMIKGRNLPMIHRGAVVDVIIVTTGGNRIKYFCQVDFSSDKQMNITLNAARAKELEDKRRFYKIKTEINCRIVDVTRNGEVTPYTPNLYGKIQDINLGGIFVVVETQDSYKLQDLISFTTVLGEERLEASARILRVQKNREGEITGYGCAFASINSRQEEMISSHINRIQIEERRLEMEREQLEKEMGSIL
jgi:c-di-GMP-binding flagellar brake protein YcgR